MERRLAVLSQWLERFAKATCFVVLLSITIVILMEIIFRKFPIINVFWAEELVQMLAVWMGLFAASVALRQGAHIGMTYLIQKISSFRLVATLTLVVQCSIACFLALAAIYGIILSGQVAIQTSPGLGISMKWAYLSVPAGCLLMLIQLVYLVVVNVNDLRRGRPKSEE